MDCDKTLKELKSWELTYIDQTAFLSHEKDFYSKFEELFHESHKQNFYWEYCTFKSYKSSFAIRLKHYQEKFYDAEMEDFIQEELDFINSIKACTVEERDLSNQWEESMIMVDYPYSFPLDEYWQGNSFPLSYDYFTSDFLALIKMAQYKKFVFLRGLLSSPKRIPTEQPTSLNFKGTQVEFVELFKALIVSGKFEENQSSVFKEMSQFLNVNLGKDENLIIQDIKQRSKQTKFLDSLAKDLYDSFN